MVSPAQLLRASSSSNTVTSPPPRLYSALVGDHELIQQRRRVWTRRLEYIGQRGGLKCSKSSGLAIVAVLLLMMSDIVIAAI